MRRSERVTDAAPCIIPKSRAASGSHNPPSSPCPFLALSLNLSDLSLCSPLSRERKTMPRLVLRALSSEVLLFGLGSPHSFSAPSLS